MSAFPDGAVDYLAHIVSIGLSGLGVGGSEGCKDEVRHFGAEVLPVPDGHRGTAKGEEDFG